MNLSIKVYLKSCLIFLFIICCAINRVCAQFGIINTIAGNGTAAFAGDGGPATSGSMNNPLGVWVDASGNIYIADAGNNRIRKVTSAGYISTIAGNGTAGYSGDGGAATAAALNMPSGICFDGSGNLYIGDYSNNRVRKVTSGGIISTVAGNGTAGFSGDGASATLAQLHNPYGVWVDGTGNLYITDMGNYRVREVSAGIISTFAGTGATAFCCNGGPATAASFSNPAGICENASGTVIFTTRAGDARVRNVNTSGIISTEMGTGAGGSAGDCGPATAAQVDWPTGLALDAAGDVYLASLDIYRVKMVVAGSNTMLTVAGSGGAAFSGDGGPAVSAGMNPSGVFVDASNNIYITGDNRLRKVTTPPATDSVFFCSGSSVALGSAMSYIDSFRWSTGATSATITVTTPGTYWVRMYVCSYFVTDTFYAVALTTPVYLGADTSICNGTPLTLHSSGVYYSPAYLWSTGSTASSIVVSTAGTYWLKVTDHGCAATDTIHIHSLTPLVNLGPDTTICVGPAINLHSSYTYTSPTYLWNTTSTASNINVSASGAYWLNVTVGGCTGTDTVIVTVNPYVIPAVMGPPVVCAGASVNFTDASPGGGWSSGNVSVATVGALSGVVAGVAAGTAMITYTVGAGCITIKNVTVNPVPMPIFGTTQVCQGLTTTLADPTSGGSWSSSDYTVASTGSSTGVVTGVNAGTVSITYTLPSTGCYAIASFTVNPTPDPISGVTAICLGGVTILSDIDPGGTWTSSPMTTAVAGASTGLITGLSTGPATVTFVLPTGCITTTPVTVYPNPAAITGPAAVCVSGTITLADPTGGGAWSSSNTAVANVVSTLGLASGVSAGTAVISYILGTGCYATTTITVTASPGAITGAFSLCDGSSTTLGDAIGGGVWTSSNTAVGTIASSTGVLTGEATGTTTITYSLGGSCKVIRTETVLASPALITGAATVCAGSTVALSDATTGGAWSSGSTGIAIAGTTGIISGLAAGTAVITYKIGDGCMQTTTLVVSPAPSPITGIPHICLDSATTLSDAIASGVWSGGGTVASVGPSSGIVSGSVAGTAIITYSVGSCSAMLSFTVNPLPAPVTGTTSVCAGASTTLSDATTGGSWISSNTSVATAGSSSGIIAGIAAGTDLVIFRLSTGCISTTTITVNAMPSAITGIAGLCAGTAATLADITSSGTWISGNTTVATIDSFSGLLGGVSGGTSVITYTLGSSCIVTKAVTVYPTPSAPGGPHALCAGATITLSDAVTGGSWNSGSAGVATVGMASGIVTGISLGTTIITYTAPGGCIAYDTISVSPTPTAIAGPANVCKGTAVAWSDAISGGLWSSSSAAVAIIGSLSGTLAGESPGTSSITYSLGGSCSVYKTVTVIASPGAITGAAGICAGATAALSDTTAGGAWSSSNTATGTVSAAGMVYGVAAGTAVISYLMPSGCLATTTVTVSPVPSAITGLSGFCPGATATYTDLVPGGLWTSSNSSVAMIGSLSGVATGVSAGAWICDYTLGSSCYASKTVTVYAAPAPVGGPPVLCPGSAITLTDAVSGGVWASSNTAVASIGTASGMAGGVTAGIATIAYTIGDGCTALKTITVNPLPAAITGPTGICAGTVTALGDATVGGAWASSASAVATVIPATGVTNGIAPGTCLVTYTLPTGCYVVTTVTVNPSPLPVTGTAIMCAGSCNLLSDGITGGTWASGSAGTAAIGSGTGLACGVASGTAIITYTLPAGCNAMVTVTVKPSPSAIIGATNMCRATTTDYSDPTGGGTWASSNTAVALINASSGVVNAVAAGSAIITYTLPAGCSVTQTLLVNPAATAIIVPAHVCSGACYTLTDAVSGGSWTSSNPSAATIMPLTGLLCAVTTGTTIITYSIGAGCTASATVAVSAPPAAITGILALCEGTATALSDSTISGAWSSSNIAVAAAASMSGSVTGVSGGTAAITYTISNGCTATAEVTVNPVSPVTGPPAVCQGLQVTFADTIPGGSWVSGNTAAGTIDASSGVITGIAPGASPITYTTPGGCASVKTITVNATPAAITGMPGVCTGTSAALGETITGGAWSSGTTAIATVGLTGIVSGIAAGTDVITYRLPAGCQVTDTVTVYALPVPISGSTGVCQGASSTLGDGTTGGLWASSNTAVATIGALDGIVSGVSPGTVVITYRVGSGCSIATTVTVHPTPSAIAGEDHLCLGLYTGLSETTAGGLWSSSTGAAVIGTGGVVYGAAAGTAVISYTLPGTGCGATLPFTVIAPPSAISGAAALCAGSAITFTDAIPGGAWGSSDISVASINAITGMATALSSGTVLISYTLGSGCMVIRPFIVNPLSPIDGPAIVCAGQSISLTDTTEGGAWSSSNITVATVAAGGDTIGIATGVSPGTAVITYTLPTGCMAAKTVIVNEAPGAISGTTFQVCAGQSVTLTDGTPFGTWTSGNTAIATIGSLSGIVTGMGAGTAVISYLLGGCAALATVTVNPLPAPIAGSTEVCTGSAILLTDSAGGTWSSGSPFIATVDSTSGMVTGSVAGAAVITYRVATGCIVTDTITVNSSPGAITGLATFCAGSSSILSDATGGGTWSSGNTAIATVSGPGDVTGVATGTALISYTLGSGCAALRIVDIISLPPGISGPSNVCAGSRDSLSDGTAGGAWTSSSTATATITFFSGVLTGVSAGTATVTYSLGAGCMATNVITVIAPPPAITGPGQVCQGMTAILTDAGGSGVWSSGNPLTAIVDSFSGVISGASAGTALISYTQTGTGCSTEITVTVDPRPVPFTGNPVICLGATTTLGETVAGGVWSSSAVAVAAAGSAGVIHGVSLGTATISYTLGAGGCQVQETVTVVPLPRTYTVSGGGSYCAGGAGMALTLSGSDAGTNYILYRGYTATGAFAGTGYAIDLAPETVGGIYTVVAINTTTGCTQEMTGSATITVIPTVAPAVGISGGSDTICAGTSVTYTAAPVNGGPAPAYIWNVNGVNVGTGNTYTYIPAGGDVVKVTVTSDATCPLPDTASHAVTMDVQARQYPVVALGATPGDTVCAGMAVTFTAWPEYGGPSPSYTWMRDGGTAGTGPVFTCIPANGDTVWCIMASDYPCLVTAIDTSIKQVITVDTPIIPTVAISAYPGTIIPAGRSITLTAEVTNGGASPSYQWYVNGYPIPGATSVTFTKNNFDSTFQDSVSVVVMSSGVCPMSTHNWVYIQVSDEGVKPLPQAGGELSILPNPDKGVFTITGTLNRGATGMAGQVTIEITDLLGQVVYQNSIQAPGGKINEHIALSNRIANGMYLLTVHTETGNMVFHIVVER